MTTTTTTASVVGSATVGSEGVTAPTVQQPVHVLYQRLNALDRKMRIVW